MEIIKRGRLSSEGEAKWTCERCKSVIKSKMSEGKRVNDQRDGDYIKCHCPVCQYENCITIKLYK